MRLFILAIGIIFCLFPYTQIVELESYNQPYALFFCTIGAIVSFDQLSRDFPRVDLLLLLLLLLVGFLLFVATCMPSPNAVELKSLLSYLSPLMFCLAAFAMARSAPILTYKIVATSAKIWIFVGLVQTLIAPSFAAQFVGQWQDAATVVVESGRGVLGLAPEPTHHAFHLLVMATALIVLHPDRRGLPALCVLAALLIARSSSALLAIALGSVLYLAIFGGRARLVLLAAIPAHFAMQAAIASGLIPDSIRLFQLVKLLYQNPAILLAADASVNARIGGIIVGIQEIIRNNFMPAGMSNSDWIRGIGLIVGRNSWLIDLSTSGVPSGILIIVYQAGWFGAFIMLGIAARMFTNHESRLQSWFVAVSIFVFMSQYFISTPGFGMLYGLLLARNVRRIRPGVRSSQAPVEDRVAWG